MDTFSLQDPSSNLLKQLDEALPQTQCTKCGFPNCFAYAKAMSTGEAEHNRCPPGGEQGVIRLSKILNLSVKPLNIECGVERPRPVAFIREKECIGCTLCIQACPVDAIVGAPKQLHLVVNARCTGCDLCVPPCPVDCITMIPLTESRTGWNAWSEEQAQNSKKYYEARKTRLEREKKDLLKRQSAKAASKLKALQTDGVTSQTELDEKARKKAIIEAAMARAKEQLQARDLK